MKIHSSRAPHPVGPYPHARKVGDFIFVSGMGPRKPGTSEIPGVMVDASGQVVDYDFEKQVRATIENIALVLDDAGSSLEEVVDVTAFLVDLRRDFTVFNRVYGEYFGSSGPTRTTVEVTALPTPIAVELKVIAYKGDKNVDSPS